MEKCQRVLDTYPNKTDVAESALYSYNDSNQLVSAKLFDGKKSTTVTYTYDENGNLISEIGAYGTDQVETYYDYTVENRLQAVYDADRLLMAAAYDGDGNRVFQLNYNLHTDEDWKGNNGNGNGNNKDNAGSGNNGNGNSSSRNNSNSGNGNGSSISGNDISTGNNGNPGNSGNGKGDGNTGNTGNGTGNSGNIGNGNGNDNSGNNGNGSDRENSKSEGTDDAGYGNATNAEEHNSQNQSGILFPAAEEISRTETDLIAMIKTTGKEKDYELIEYISNVNIQYTQVLMELNENGAMDAAYTYGTSRLTEDRFTGESNFYLYDPSGNVAGITDQDGYLWQSYRYDAFGNATFGSPQYDNEYTFNGESYNPNIHSQYLRARYYDTVKGSFLTEDSYLGDIRNPLTLNRYSYCIGNPLFYSDPSGHWGVDLAALESEMLNILNERDRRVSEVTDYIYDKTGEILGTHNDSEVAQIVSGFVAGFVGSFYETFDLITNPEIILATVFEAVTHPFETALGVIKNKYTKGMDAFFQYLVEENYRMIGQEVGRMAGEKLQDLIAAAVVASVLQTCGDGNGGEGDSKPRLNTYGDALREKLGPAYLSNPEEYNAILNDAKEMGVSVEFRKGTLAYDMEFGKPGKLIIDPEASIGGLRHEYRHMLDDFSLEHPGMRIIADGDKFWELEFRGYLEELNLARKMKDYDAGKFIIGEMRQRRMEILGR